MEAPIGSNMGSEVQSAVAILLLKGHNANRVTTENTRQLHQHQIHWQAVCIYGRDNKCTKTVSYVFETKYFTGLEHVEICSCKKTS